MKRNCIRWLEVKKYTKEFKNTIAELYNSGKNSTELSSEYTLLKSTITGWIKKKRSITINKDTTMTTEEYQALLNKNAKPEEEIEILKKAMAYSQGSNKYI